MKCLINLKAKIDSLLESIYEEITITIILLYIGIVERTSVVSFRGDHSNCILLFWHENIYSLVLLRKILKKNVSVVVADSNRLKYWTKLLHRLKIGIIVSNNPLWIKKAFKYRNHKIALALDGPFGPNKAPNNNVINALIRFNINSIFVYCNLSKRIEIGKNWNKMVLPAPFSRINFEFKKYSMP